ncbi:AAA family ATPase [Heyndrickxia sp. NPDC080065]|uniref:AAA family ATPase n=1 Tax=Heyndrickxia sp. NPDC080065 TaxID=3390568 RepID=UPI003D05F99F
MKPLKLMMQAFGPYAEKEVIDFTSLGNRTMFVISGKTGSGKTTIFDGISFAIYGKASGEDRNGSDLRSQFANDEVLTEVSLLFSLKNKTYYIWRSPQQEKRKARGDGYTTVGAKAELYILDEDGNKQIIASNVREADEKIKEIIQLDANQFRQILMIPQGEFRKLLTSDSKDKEVILQRLFHTELYKRIEEHLKEEATSLKQYVESKIDERSLALKSIHYNDNEELKEAIQEEIINDVKAITLLSDEVLRMKKNAMELQTKIEQTKKNRDEAKRKFDEAEALLVQFEKKEKLKIQKEDLLSQKEFFDQMKKEIDDAYKASRLEQQDLLCHRLKKEYDSYYQDFLKSTEQLKAVNSALEIAEKRLLEEEDKASERERLAAEYLKLTNLKEEVYSFSERQQELQKLERELKTIESKIDFSKQNIKTMEDKLSTKRIEQKMLEELRVNSLENEKELDIISNHIQKLSRLEALLQKEKVSGKILIDKTNEYENMKMRLKDAKATLYSLEYSWQKGQASLLAQSLEPDTPCPVCGSTHHPHLSSNHEDIPTESDLKSARTAVEQLEGERITSETSWLEIKSSQSHIKEAIEENRLELLSSIPNLTLQTVSETLQLFQEKQRLKNKMINEQKIKIKQLLQTGNEINDLEEKIDIERKTIETLLLNEKDISQIYTEKKTAIQSSLKNIPEDIKRKEDYDKKVNLLITQKEQMIQAFETAKNQVHQQKEQLSGARATNEQLKDLLEKSDQSLKEEREIFLKMLNEEGFSGYKQFVLAKRERESIKQLEQRVQTYREDYRSVSDRLLEMVERLENVEKPNIESLHNRFIDFENLHTKLTSEHTNILLNIHHNEEINNKVIMINNSIKEAEEQYKLIGHLSNVARGQNTYRITFERYVLAAFLDDILRVANIRLTRMTSGRYHLLRKTDRSKGNVQSGLELLIFDQYTGQERHVKTLSGGESFKAALSLALGLAEVVQQYAGGVSLETMFIDEGFGTLDPESLDQAIEALIDIQNSGRLVGIISHVPELKERIDVRLEVFASQNGSRTEFQFIN